VGVAAGPFESKCVAMALSISSRVAGSTLTRIPVAKAMSSMAARSSGLAIATTTVCPVSPRSTATGNAMSVRIQRVGRRPQVLFGIGQSLGSPLLGVVSLGTRRMTSETLAREMALAHFTFPLRRQLDSVPRPVKSRA